MDRYLWDRQLYRWQDYVPPPGRWALDLLITVLFVFLVLFAHAGAPSPASHAQTAALVIAECAKRAPPHSDLRWSHPSCRLQTEAQEPAIPLELPRHRERKNAKQSSRQRGLSKASPDPSKLAEEQT